MGIFHEIGTTSEGGGLYILPWDRANMIIIWQLMWAIGSIDFRCDPIYFKYLKNNLANPFLSKLNQLNDLYIFIVTFTYYSIMYVIAVNWHTKFKMVVDFSLLLYSCLHDIGVGFIALSGYIFCCVMVCRQFTIYCQENICLY